MKKLPEEVGRYVADLPTDQREFSTPDTHVLEFFQHRYCCSLQEVVEKGNFVNSKGEKRVLTIAEKLRMGKEIATVLKAMHGSRLLHRDIKTGNVLVSDEGGFPSARVNDFDLASGLWGFDTRLKNKSYPYWPVCSQNSWSLPVCDSYGFAILLGELMFGNSFYRLASDRQRLSGAAKEFHEILVRTVKETAESGYPSLLTDESWKSLPSEDRFYTDVVVFLTQKAKEDSFQKDAIERTIAAVKALLYVYGLINRCVRKDAELLQKINVDEKFKACLQDLAKPHHTIQEKERHRATLQTLYSYIPSMAELKDSCEEIYKILTI